jgi:hypothetical protein
MGVMARPPLPLGTYGRIRVYRHGDSWRARTLYRDWDGTTRHVEKYARTQAWWNEIEQGSHSPGTRRNYRDRLDRQVIPTLGRLRVRELTTGAIDRRLRVVRDKHGAGTAKLTRTVLSGICGLAARYDALDRNHRGMSVARGGPGQRPWVL